MTTSIRYSDFLENEHFQNIAASIRSIRFNNPNGDFLNARDMLVEATWPYIANAWLERFVDLQVIMAEKYEIRMAVDDIEWLTQQLDTTERPDAFVSLLLAYANAPEEMLTPVEIAELTGTAESGWRNKAAAGLLPGSAKKGKQWLIPKRYATSK